MIPSLTRLVICLLGLSLTVQPLRTVGDPGSSLPPEDLVIGLRAARLELMRGERDEGLRRLHELAESHPQEILPVIALWDYHRANDSPPAEVQRLRALLAQRLADGNSALPPGTVRYLVESPEASEEEMTMVLDAARRRLDSMESPDPQLLEAVGVLQDRLGRLDEARDSFARAHELQPRRELLWRVFVIDRRLEHWEDAAATLESLSGTTAPDEMLRMARIEVLAKLGRHEELVTELSALSDDPLFKSYLGPYSELLLRAAWDLRDAGKEQEAEALFRELAELDPENTSARLALLYFYSSEEERRAHEKAVRDRRAAESDPTALAQEGADLLAAGDAAGAFDLLKRAAKALPEFELAWFNLGLAATRLERWSVAEEAFQRAAEINPSRVESVVQHGVALHKLGRCEEAVKQLERALDVQPELGQAHYYLYACYAELGDQERAGEHLRLYNESR